jgi:excisionase family DNA binding protein
VRDRQAASATCLKDRPSAMDKRYLNIREASQYLGYAVSTLYGWVSQRRIPFFKKGGRLRFDRKRLDEWMREDENHVIRLSE